MYIIGILIIFDSLITQLKILCPNFQSENKTLITRFKSNVIFRKIIRHNIRTGIVIDIKEIQRRQYTRRAILQQRIKLK